MSHVGCLQPLVDLEWQEWDVHRISNEAIDRYKPNEHDYLHGKTALKARCVL